MTFSLNEVEAQARKATRGVGYSFGMADDAGWAVRWLCAKGLDGVGALAQLLRAVLANEGAPKLHSGDWCLEKGTLCPLYVGVSLADSASADVSDTRQWQAVQSAELLLPFVAAYAAKHGTTVAMTSHARRAVTDGASLCVEGQSEHAVAPVTVTLGGQMSTCQSPVSRVQPSGADWSLLQTCAARTYAPATEASRLKGAGAEGDDDS